MEPASASTQEVAPFLRSLRCMLETEDPGVLRWTADGYAFEVHDMRRMSERVLPKYFKHRKYASFQRQLNYFSFRKWTKSRAVVCTFSNAFFQRDQPALASRIERKKSLHSSPRASKGKSKAATTPRKSDKQDDAVVIKVPVSEANSPSSFPSPTDTVDMTELDLRRVYGQVADDCFHEPRAAPRATEVKQEADEFSLDWVDALFSSLDWEDSVVF